MIWKPATADVRGFDARLCYRRQNPGCKNSAMKTTKHIALAIILSATGLVVVSTSAQVTEPFTAADDAPSGFNSPIVQPRRSDVAEG